jgi:alpha-tubulin suppressor-like RCC1 family protein
MNLQRSHSSLANTFTFITDVDKLVIWGTQPNNNIHFPRELRGLGPSSSTVPLLSYSGGLHHNLALTQDGKLYVWGSNDMGQLGLGHTQRQNTPVLLPWPPEGSKEKKFRSVHCGVFYSLAITEDGNLFGWSTDTLMGSDNSGNPYRPRQILVPAPVVHVACGYNSVMAITGSGEVYGWGTNYNGELGMCAKQEKISKPTLHVELTKRGVRSLVCGGSHGLAIVQDGSVLGWGYNATGTLGTGDTIHRFTPVPLISSEDAQKFSGISEICAGNGHSMALTGDGTVFIWGDNRFSQIGLRQADIVSVPTILNFTPQEGREGSVTEEDAHLTVGSQSSRDLGQGKKPKEGGPRVIFVGTGMNNSFAMKEDGELFVWGHWEQLQMIPGAGHVPVVLPEWKFRVPPSSQEFWEQIFFWLFLGIQDLSSIFSELNVEVIFSLVSVIFGCQ